MRLDLVVGPNGAGKSTFVEEALLAAPPDRLFVNADAIAAAHWPKDPAGHSYEAARLAADTREALIATKKPFIAETVFSHPSKLELISRAQGAGYYVALHVIMVPVELSVLRVAQRVAGGGHSVPEEKIRERYARLWDLVATAIRIADAAHVYDNSQRSGPLEVASFAHGFVYGACQWPAWTPPALMTTSP